MDLQFTLYQGSLDDWGQVLRTFADYEVFQTPEWIRYLAETQLGKPVMLQILDGELSSASSRTDDPSFGGKIVATEAGGPF